MPFLFLIKNLRMQKKVTKKKRGNKVLERILNNRS